MSNSTKTSSASVLEKAKQLQSKIVELRRHLHAHPELSFHEFETAKLSAEKLAQLGYSVKTGVGKTGVVADFSKGDKKNTGVTIAIRADMDGLPIEETNKASYLSKNKGVMHACGHDAHVSCGLAAAEILTGEETGGRIRMLMQPAEEFGDDEGKSGAYRMLEDDALNGVSAVIGLHMDAGLEAGKVAIMPGPVMAAADGFTIKIKGVGGHGAYPETTVDAVVLGAQVVQAVQQIVSRRISALDPAIITIGSFHSSSSRGNVISDEVILEGTFRTFNEEVRKHIVEELEKACSIARMLGGDYEIKYEMGYPTTVNDPEIAEIMKRAAIDLIGAENVITVKPKTWSEDFSMFAQKVPGAFMFLGGEIKGDTRLHHSPTFDLDESGLWIGTAVLAETAKRLVTH
ncbi:MAG TPA: amidohydrolase, partial [Candidatus Melainabacteria bacterium]|nr:amidohydrolase [Candidatus Melainabacteria bacterium]